MNGAPVLRARRILDRLKRGVPPTEGLIELCVGMEKLEARLQDLLQPERSPRWFAVQSEYGEGKSHFHAFARQRALEAGYAVASLDVNKDDGAPHHPQRHLAVLLDSLRSPLGRFAELPGMGEMVRGWLENTPLSEVVPILQRCQAVVPHAPAGRDPGEFGYRVYALTRHAGNSTMQQSCRAGLVRYFSAEDLISRGPMARFAASYRLQVLQQWLLETGHQGLLLFVDEVDNVIRQIHGKGHPGCYRTLGWYCCCPGLADTRVVFASTPEVLDRLDHGGADHYLNALRSQVTVRPEEVAVYRYWMRELEDQARGGWVRCPRLTVSQRVELFSRITGLYRIAWGRASRPSQAQLEDLARQPQFTTTRRWVRAVVHILEVSNQSSAGVEAAPVCLLVPAPA
jgi:hypothetical protein